MPAQWRGEAEFDRGKLVRQSIAGFGQVVDDVNAGREKIRQHHDRCCSPLDAHFTTSRDIRLREFEISDLDMEENSSCDHFIGNVNEIGICIGTPRAVGDEEEGGFV